MKMLLAFLAALVFQVSALPAFAQSVLWVQYASIDDGTSFSFRKESLRIERGPDGETMVGAISRMREPNGAISYSKIYISTDVCASGEGQIFAIGLDGELKFKVDYVASGGNVTSAAGDVLCSAYDNQIRQEN